MYLLDDYSSASSVLLASVEELRESTEKVRASPLHFWTWADRLRSSQMTTHIKRIERVETELEKVVKNAAGKSDVESLRAEYKKLIVSLTGSLELDSNLLVHEERIMCSFFAREGSSQVYSSLGYRKGS